MKTLKKVEVNFEKVHYIPKHSKMEEGVIYISDEFGTSSHLCLCGCKELTVMPLGKDGWAYHIDALKGLTMTPSVGNFQLPCKSHYIITKGNANFV